MGIKLEKEYLKRYKDLGALLLKYGNSDLVKNAGLSEALNGDGHKSNEVRGQAEELTKDLESLGPAFVKVGQLLSTRADFLPTTYMEALSRLQDNCEPFPFAEVEKIVTNELGVRMSKAFQDFQSEPLAAASLGQIHRATMRNGRAVAVKIQRPDIREQVVRDLDVLSDVAQFYDTHTKTGKRYEFGRMLEEFRKTILDELDYRKEAQNLTTIKENLSDFPLIFVPEPVLDYSSSKVLTMSFVSGKKVTSISKLELLDLDGPALAEQLYEAYLKQILVDGFFHADPHPGNVFLTDEKQIALIDLGMVSRLSDDMQAGLLKFLLAVSEGHGDEAASVIFELGEQKDDFNENDCRHKVNELVQKQYSSNLQNMEIGKTITSLTRVTAESGLRLPPELTMLGKTLMNLDQVGAALDPNFDANAATRKNAAKITRQRMIKSISPGNLFSNLHEAKEFTEKFPSRVNKILDLIATNRLRMKVDAIDETVLIDAFQKVANRITCGLVLAALIIGASLLMRVPTQFTIFGYPGLAIVCFLAAAAGGFGLVINIMFYDQAPQLMNDKTR